MEVGSYVENFGVLCYVRSIRENGTLVVENPRIGRWIADPDKCILVKPPVQEI